MFRLCLFPGIKVSAEPLHENTIVNSPGQDWLLEVPAELQSKCTVTNNTTTTTTQARSSQHRLYDSPSQGSQQQLPSLTVMSLIKNNQFIVRTGLVFFSVVEVMKLFYYILAEVYMYKEFQAMLM